MRIDIDLRQLIVLAIRDNCRTRCRSMLSAVTRQFAARLSQIDYDREMTFVRRMPRAPTTADRAALDMERILDAIHLVMTPDRDTAEFSVIVASDTRGKGLGYLLMRHMIEYAERQDVKRIYGHVKQTNSTMLTISLELGFEVAVGPADDGLVRVSRNLARSD